jgi:hypothetical protein
LAEKMPFAKVGILDPDLALVLEILAEQEI